MKAFRILHVAREPVTGVWSVIKTLALEQAKAGYEVRLGLFVTSKWPYRSELHALGIPHFLLNSPAWPGTAAYLWHWGFETKVDRWIHSIRQESKGPIVVHHHNAWLAGCLIGRRTLDGVTQIVTFHGSGDGSLARQPVRRWIHRRMARRLCAPSIHFVTVDSQTPQIMRRTLGIEERRFTLVPNGVTPVGTLVRTYPDSGPMRVCFASDVTRSKGWNIVADAASELRTQGCEIEATFCGSGTDAVELQDWCSSRPWARYLGYVTNLRESILYHQDVLCLPSLIEGMPMIVLEAMWAGLVVVVTRVGALPDLVQDTVNGYFTDRNVQQLASVLRGLYHRRGQIEKVGQAARATVLAKYSSKAMCDKYSEVYTLHSPAQ